MITVAAVTTTIVVNTVVMTMAVMAMVMRGGTAMRVDMVVIAVAAMVTAVATGHPAVMAAIAAVTAVAAAVLLEATVAEGAAEVLPVATEAGAAGAAAIAASNMPAPMIPRYKCHKVVQALQIDHLFGNEVHFIDKRYAPVRAENGMFARYMPAYGDYFVWYDDGYKSFSPQKAFEDGYTLIPEGSGA